MAKQSKQDRLRRLNSGGCPVHNIGMPQIGDWYLDGDGLDYYLDGDGLDYTIVGCPRHDRNILAHAYSGDGPWRIHPDFAYVIDEAPDNEAI